ncbi:hypothetical protein E2I00_018474, partial [Balaenoptera physalus]
FSIITVASYIILALLFVTISFRVYKSVIQAVQKSKGHAIKLFSESDPINRGPKPIMCFFLVKDLAVFMWLMTNVSAVPMESPF